MSRFADPTSTETVDFGECECPGKPHPSDWAKLRADLSGSEIAILMNLSGMDQEASAEAVAPFILEWNLLDTDGEPVEPSAVALYALKGPTANAIGAGIGKILRRNIRSPNRSSAPSRASSRGSASHTRTATPSRTTSP